MGKFPRRNSAADVFGIRKKTWIILTQDFGISVFLNRAMALFDSPFLLPARTLRRIVR